METKIKEKKEKIWVPKKAMVHAHRRKKGFFRCYGVIYIDSIKPKINSREIIELRLYESPSRIYACAWIRMYEHKLKNPFGENELTSVAANGSGYAGGGGYDLSAAAIAEALHKCGIPYEVLQSIDSGIDQVPSVLAKLAGMFGYDPNKIIVYQNYE